MTAATRRPLHWLPELLSIGSMAGLRLQRHTRNQPDGRRLHPGVNPCSLHGRERRLPGLMLIVAAVLALSPPAFAAAPVVPAPNAPLAEIVACAEARAQYNLMAFPSYSVRVTSIRQGLSMDGKLEDENKVVKTVAVTPQGRKEQFERGEKNGKPAEAGEFWLEKLGLSGKYNAEGMNLFAAKNRGRYAYTLRGTEPVNGKGAWKLDFKARQSGEQELQDGQVWLDQASCGIMKAVGTFPKVWVTDDIKAQLTLTEARPGLWLPANQRVDMIVDVPLMSKRRARMIDEFAQYQVTQAK